MPSENKKRNDGYVYFILGEKTHRVKIGKAKDAWKRKSDLQVGSPDNLTMLLISAYTSDAFALEQYFHNLFQKSHVRDDWFEFGSGIKQYIEDERLRIESVRIAKSLLNAYQENLETPVDFDDEVATDIYAEKLPLYIHGDATIAAELDVVYGFGRKASEGVRRA